MHIYKYKIIKNVEFNLTIHANDEVSALRRVGDIISNEKQKDMIYSREVETNITYSAPKKISEEKIF